jgi:hypothetical protein
MTSTENETFADYDTAEWRAQTAVDRGIRDIVVRTSGPAAFREEPVWEGAKSTHMVADAAASIRAAIMIRDRANYELDSLIRKARGKGSTWEGIAVLLGYTDNDEQDNTPAERAFYFAAPQTERFTPSTTSWKCSKCGETIIDRGPFESHPEDNERGHRGFEEDKPGKKCPRQAAAVEAWAKRNNW